MNKTSPNILVVITDQQNVDSLAAYRTVFADPAYHCHWVKTPHLDRLVRDGYSFIESHSPNPLCSPARSAIFTGRYSSETGVEGNGMGIDRRVPNLGEWFEQNSDYQRVYCGKWHAGGNWTYPDSGGRRTIPGFSIIPVGTYTPGLTGDVVDFQVSGALSGFIRNYSDPKPFLAVAALMNPHDICSWKGKVMPADDYFGINDRVPPLPPNFEAEFEKKYLNTEIAKQLLEKRLDRFSPQQWRNYLYDYERMIEKVDADVGRLLAAVESRDDETLVVFTSDHGEGAARHKRTEKNSPYEEALKVPLVFVDPKRPQRGVLDRDNLVSGLDLVPTLCAYAGIPAPPHCRGESLRAIIEGRAARKRRNFVFAELKQTVRIVRSGDYKYVKFYRHSGQRETPFVRKSDGGAEKFQPGRGSDRYVDTGLALLFDLRRDPWETRNLAEEPASAPILAQMEQLLADEFETVILPGTSYLRN